jgi:hypothetical protein
LCNRPAIAYRLDGDGTRTYLCDEHIPQEDAEFPQALAQNVTLGEITPAIPKDENL